MCSNIPISPAYGVYISQLIRYARVSSNYSDFLKRHLYLRNRLLDQGYKKICLIRSLYQLRDVNTICKRNWYIAAHILKIYDFKIEVLPFIINVSTELTTVVKFEV
jgi:histidinol phosphatase-like enzyme